MNPALLIFFIALIFAAFFAGILVEHVRRECVEMHRRIHELEEIVGGKRHTHSTLAGIEDAYFVIRRILNEDQEQAEVRNYWIQKVDRILSNVRQGPTAYDVDQPAGRRPNGGNNA